MTKILCLANSRKYGDRCIAGIDLETGQWIRPVSEQEWGRIPLEQAVLDGMPIQPLDVIDVPLESYGRGYECENRLIRRGTWQRVGQVSLEETAPYWESALLHSDCPDHATSVSYGFLLSLPIAQRRTLQILQVNRMPVCQSGKGWRGRLALANGFSFFANITDPTFCHKLDQGYRPSNPCVVVLSFGQPWKKPNSTEENRCYRLIAAVLEVNHQPLLNCG